MTTRQINLNTVPNLRCDRCSPDSRRENQEDYLCLKATSVEDGLPVRCVGAWAYDKIFRLVQYFGIFTKGMARKWDGKLNYVEICSGPGRCVLRESGDEIDGTALAIARHPSFPVLHHALFFDYDERVTQTLEARLRRVEGGTQRRTQVVQGDFSSEADLTRTIGALPQRHLNLVLVDPTECNVPFRTIERIANCLNSVDFIINVAVGTDANRNLVRAVLDPAFRRAREKYEGFLGTDAFFTDKGNQKLAEAGNNTGLRHAFMAEYQRQLGRIGLVHTDSKTVRTYYHLLFASRDARGLEFWHKANRIEPDGQRTFSLC